MIIEIIDIKTLLVTDAKVTAKVTSPADNGAYIKSTIFPWIFPIIKEEDECENDCWMTCIAMSPGAKKLIKGTPKTSPLSSPIANDKTNKNNREVINGEIIVWIHTIRNLNTSFWYKVHAPTQFIKPNLLFPILYFFEISTINSLITLKRKKAV